MSWLLWLVESGQPVVGWRFEREMATGWPTNHPNQPEQPPILVGQPDPTNQSNQKEWLANQLSYLL